MIKNTLFVLAVMVIFPSVSFAAPAISSVSGTVSHGSTITATGSGFGIKDTAAPQKYDDFQNLSMGQELSANGWNVGGYFRPKAANTVLRPGTPFTRNADARFGPVPPYDFSVGGDASSFWLAGLSNSKVYIDAWHYFTVAANPQPQNVKPLRVHQAGAGSPNAYLNFYDPPGIAMVACGRDGVGHSDGVWGDTNGVGFYNTWVHIQWMIDAGGGNGTYTGACKVYINSFLGYDHTNVRTLSEGYYVWPEVWLGNYVRSDNHGETHAYWESVYIDKTWARVEIGNASTYSACTHREIQIPQTWSDGSISFRINRGSFAPGEGVYLYVVDSTNAVNANGYPILIQPEGGGGGNKTPMAPTIVGVL